MEFGSSNFPSLERGDWGSGKVCVWGGRAHTRTHSFSPLWSSSASSPAQLWDVPAAGSCFFLCAALFLAAAGAANLNHHFARLLLYGRLSADCGHLSTKVPPGICNIPESSQNISPNSKHRHTKIFAFFFTAQHSSWSCASRCPALTMAWPPTWSTGRTFRIQPGSHLPLLGTPPKKGGKFIPRRNSRQTTHTDARTHSLLLLLLLLVQEALPAGHFRRTVATPRYSVTVPPRVSTTTRNKQFPCNFFHDRLAQLFSRLVAFVGTQR